MLYCEKNAEDSQNGHRLAGKPPFPSASEYFILAGQLKFKNKKVFQVILF